MELGKISFILASKLSGKRKARAWEDRESNPLGKPGTKPWEDEESEDEETAEAEVESVKEFDPAKPMKKVKRVEVEENSWGYEAVTRPLRLGLGATPAPSVDKLKKMMTMITVQERCKNISVFPLPHSWLTSQIRVRVISKDMEGGKLFLKKGIVIDVVGVDPTTCDLLMDGSGALLQRVKQHAVKAALPHIGGLVMVIGGKQSQRGVVGKLLQRDPDTGLGLVRREDTYEILCLPLNLLAEFVGDPEQLAGY